MASVTPRASGFWSVTMTSSHYAYDDDEDIEQQNLIPSERTESEEYDGRTPVSLHGVPGPTMS